MNKESVNLPVSRKNRLSVHLGGIIILLTLLSGPLFSQISLNIKNNSIKEVLKEIESKTEYTFFYNAQFSALNNKVTFKVENQSIDATLQKLLSGTKLIWEKKADNQIILTPEVIISEQSPKQKIVTGTVTDEKGEAVIGANVVEKGTTNGTITDIDGKFSLRVSPDSQVEVSYLGYTVQHVNPGKQASLRIVLKEDTQKLDEIVVVGFGTQKKVNLTGSVSSISAKELAERPQPNVQNMLQGKVAGMQIVTNTAQPGRDGGAISIRGKGSFGASSDPLILVDGAIGQLNTLAPDDIESISVLKDAASASIYGARAANGVILVTTKKGKAGKAQVSYSFNYGWQQATHLGDQVWESATYMEMYNQMADRMGGRTKYSEAMINKYKDPTRDKNLYPDYNWMDESFKTGHNMTHNLSVNGGNEKVTYNVSLGYLDQDGLLEGHDYKRYTGLMNLEAQVHERIKVGATSNFYNGKVREPYYTNNSLILMINSSRPMAKPYLPDGSGRYSYESFPENYGGEWQNRNPVWAMKETSRKDEYWFANAQVYFDVDFIKKENMQLRWSTKGGFRYTDQFQKTHYPANRVY